MFIKNVLYHQKVIVQMSGKKGLINQCPRRGSTHFFRVAQNRF